MRDGRQPFARQARSGGRAGLLISMAVLGWISLGSQPSAAAASGTTPTPNVSISSPRLAGLYVRLPISFEVNRGQTDRGVKFLPSDRRPGACPEPVAGRQRESAS